MIKFILNFFFIDFSLTGSLLAVTSILSKIGDSAHKFDKFNEASKYDPKGVAYDFSNHDVYESPESFKTACIW